MGGYTIRLLECWMSFDFAVVKGMYLCAPFVALVPTSYCVEVNITVVFSLTVNLALLAWSELWKLLFF